MSGSFFVSTEANVWKERDRWQLRDLVHVAGLWWIPVFLLQVYPRIQLGFFKRTATPSICLLLIWIKWFAWNWSITTIGTWNASPDQKVVSTGFLLVVESWQAVICCCSKRSGNFLTKSFTTSLDLSVLKSNCIMQMQFICFWREKW